MDDHTFSLGRQGQLNVQLAEGLTAAEASYGLMPAESDVLARIPDWCAAAAQACVPVLTPWETGPLPWLVTVRLGGGEDGRALNRDFRGKDYATNVLSFVTDEDDAMEDGAEEWYAGDIFICLPVVAREAAEQDKPLAQHLQHLVIHGVLHLAGYDHVDAPEAERMEAEEVRILAALGIANPYMDPLMEMPE